MIIFDYIFEGDQVDVELCVADGSIFMECGTHYAEKPYIHSRYCDTINGIDIYYCYGADHFWFAEAE